MPELITHFGIFNTQDILVQSFRVNLPKTVEIFRAENQFEYNIYCSIKGNFRVFCAGRSFDLTAGDVFIAMPYENFSVVYISDKSEFEKDDKPIITSVMFASNVFDDVGDENFLRSFDNRKKGENCFYKNKEFDKNIQPIHLFNLLKKCVESNFGVAYFKSVISTLITVLDLTYDQKEGVLGSVISEEYDVKIWDYILNNCLGKITAESVEKKFNVSKWYLDKVTNKFYGKPFKKTVNAIRMWRAKTVMTQHIPLSKVALLCGFANYSTFYRAYTSFFGVNPKEDYLYYKTHFIFYSDDVNKSKETLDTF